MLIHIKIGVKYKVGQLLRPLPSVCVERDMTPPEGDLKARIFEKVDPSGVPFRFLTWRFLVPYALKYHQNWHNYSTNYVLSDVPIVG